MRKMANVLTAAPDLRRTSSTPGAQLVAEPRIVRPWANETDPLSTARSSVIPGCSDGAESMARWPNQTLSRVASGNRYRAPRNRTPALRRPPRAPVKRRRGSRGGRLASSRVPAHPDTEPGRSSENRRVAAPFDPVRLDEDASARATASARPTFSVRPDLAVDDQSAIDAEMNHAAAGASGVRSVRPAAGAGGTRSSDAAEDRASWPADPDVAAPAVASARTVSAPLKTGVGEAIGRTDVRALVSPFVSVTSRKDRPPGGDRGLP